MFNMPEMQIRAEVISESIIQMTNNQHQLLESLTHGSNF